MLAAVGLKNGSSYLRPLTRYLLIVKCVTQTYISLHGYHTAIAVQSGQRALGRATQILFPGFN